MHYINCCFIQGHHYDLGQHVCDTRFRTDMIKTCHTNTKNLNKNISECLERASLFSWATATFASSWYWTNYTSWCSESCIKESLKIAPETYQMHLPLERVADPTA